MDKLEKMFEWCLRRGKKGRKLHKGLMRIKVDKEEIQEHIDKAIHNLQAMDYNVEGGFTDWAANAAFYAMYHALLALLHKLGYESRNQECTISAIELFIKRGLVELTLEDIRKVRNAQALESNRRDAKGLRERMQYGTETSLEAQKMRILRSDAKEIINKVRVAIKRLGG